MSGSRCSPLRSEIAAPLLLTYAVVSERMLARAALRALARVESTPQNHAQCVRMQHDEALKHAVFRGHRRIVVIDFRKIEADPFRSRRCFELDPHAHEPTLAWVHAVDEKRMLLAALAHLLFKLLSPEHFEVAHENNPEREFSSAVSAPSIA